MSLVSRNDDVLSEHSPTSVKDAPETQDIEPVTAREANGSFIEAGLSSHYYNIYSEPYPESRI